MLDPCCLKNVLAEWTACQCATRWNLMILIPYYMAVQSLAKIPMDNINCQNNVFKKCPTTLSKSRFPRRRLQYCCCNTTKCNGNYLHRRETKVIPKGIDKNKSDIAVPELKRAAQDINMPESVMGNLLEANKVSRISWGLISGIACAVVVMVCIVAIAVVFINRRRQKRQTVLNASVGEMVSLRTDADDADNNDDVPGMICTPGGNHLLMWSIQIEQIQLFQLNLHSWNKMH
ncbi:hypothetical protein DINM_005109 [Dirofilaria immitis]|nr:hypothetical protein [Dirofilaria immitis]